MHAVYRGLGTLFNILNDSFVLVKKAEKKQLVLFFMIVFSYLLK